MNMKKTLENRIRGWLPSTPKTPHIQPITPELKSLKAVVNPLPPISEKKYQRNIGMVVGIGLGLLLIGSAGALIAYINYNDLLNLLNSNEINLNHVSNTLFRNLLDQIALYSTLAVLGIAAIIAGILGLKSKFFREIWLNKRPYVQEGNFLAGIGASFVMLSFSNLLQYLLYLKILASTHNYINLNLSVIFVGIGACLIFAGVLTWSRTK